MKYWHNLLIDWRKKGKTGLTIPFIIGSQDYIDGNNKQKIEDLINDIMNQNNPIYLTYCLHIKELILAIKKDNFGNFTGEYMFDKESKSNLYVSKIVLDNLNKKTKEDLIAHLNDKYEYYIKKQLYSSHEGELSNFTDSDIKFIKESIIK